MCKREWAEYGIQFVELSYNFDPSARTFWCCMTFMKPVFGEINSRLYTLLILPL
jgi:hypothetical protein